METCKIRLIARGDEQCFGIDFEQMFSFVMKWGTLQIIIALSTHLDWELFHLDVNFFLNGELHEKIYVIQLEGFVVIGQKNKLCHLKKTFYGLKQALGIKK